MYVSGADVYVLVFKMMAAAAAVVAARRRRGVL